jgi:5'-AMP-activated protein kinase catalytic alpha subunit
MEFACNGELFQHIVSQKRIAESEACKYLQQLISGTEYIHRLGIVHRDLKPENLLFDSEWNIKIVDFGLSNLYQRKGEC